MQILQKTWPLVELNLEIGRNNAQNFWIKEEEVDIDQDQMTLMNQEIIGKSALI